MRWRGWGSCKEVLSASVSFSAFFSASAFVAASASLYVFIHSLSVFCSFAPVGHRPRSGQRHLGQSGLIYAVCCCHLQVAQETAGTAAAKAAKSEGKGSKGAAREADRVHSQKVWGYRCKPTCTQGCKETNIAVRKGEAWGGLC